MSLVLAGRRPPPDGKPFVFRGANAEILRYKGIMALLEGPAGTGKSAALLTKSHLFAAHYAKCRILWLRQERRSLTESILAIFEQHIVRDDPRIVGGANRENRSHYDYPNGSIIVLGGLEDGSKIIGAEYDLVVCFEATEMSAEPVYKMLSRMQRRNPRFTPYSQLIIECNPVAPEHWINQDAAAGRFPRFRSRHEDNPSVTPEYLETLRSLPPILRARLYEGRWISDTPGDAVFDSDALGWLRDQLGPLAIHGAPKAGSLALELPA